MTEITPIIDAKYLPIWHAALPYFAQARPGDLKHSLAIVNEANRQGQILKLDLDVLIPAAIFHDIGHAAILPEHLWMVTGPDKLKGSKLVHMLTGAKIAKDVLTGLSYDPKKIEHIVKIISIHDSTEKEVFDTQEAIVLSDIDKLARFTPEGFAEVLEEFGLNPDVAVNLLRDEMISKIILPENKAKGQNYLKELAKKYKVQL